MLAAEARSLEGFAALLQPADAARFMHAVLAAEDFRMDVSLSDGRLVRVTAGFDADGASGFVHGTVEDVSDRHENLAERTAREELCQAIAENSPAMLWMGDQSGKCVFLNRALREFWGVDPEDLSAFDWGSTVHPDDLGKLAGPFTKGMTERAPFAVEARYRRADGQYRTLRTQANPRFDSEGNFLGMSGVNADVTDELEAQERTRLLMGELNHRTKNLLSIVQAVTRQTVRSSSPEAFSKTLDDRLRGLAASNDLLLRGNWTGVDLTELVHAQLAHLRDLIGERILLRGPRLRIAAGTAQTLGMALHELSTNSLKHGALAVETGRVELAWDGPRSDGEAGFTISWVETGVEGVNPPSRRGFGHTVMVDMVASALDADVELHFDPGGLRWLVSARSGIA